MMTHLYVPRRNDVVSLIALLLDSRFTINQLTLIEWHDDKHKVISDFCQPRGIQFHTRQWHNWHQSIDSSAAWLIADHFHPDSWQAEQQALSQGLTLASIDNDHLYWLANPPNQQPQNSSLNLADNLTLEHYFPLFNWSIKQLDRNKIADSRRQVANQWRKRIQYGKKALSHLNYLASTSNAEFRTVLNRQQQYDTTLNAFIDELVMHGMASLSGKYLTFRDYSARFFANGGWLEELTFSDLTRLQQKLPKLQDVARNVCIEQWVGDQRFEQELDVVCLYDNQLVIVECKTKNYHKKGNSTNNDLKLTLAQLSAMKKTLGPPIAKVVFVSFFELSPTSKARASQWGVEVLDGSELSHMTTHLRMALK